MDKIEKAPGAESGGTEGLGGSLADAQLSDMKDMRTMTMNDSAANAIGDNSSFEFQNEQGNMYQLDSDGKVSKFTYTDGGGDVVSTFSDITRDDNGEVDGFKMDNGDVYTRLPADETSIFAASHDGGGWHLKNEQTGEEEKSPVALGKVTIDENGVSADGMNAYYLNIPEEE